MQQILTFIVVLSISVPAVGQDAVRLKQSDYRASLCAGMSQEVPSRGGSADCATETLAVEVDWVYNWKGAMGQALAYASGLPGRVPALILVCDRPDTECVWHIDQARGAIAWLERPFELWICSDGVLDLDACEHAGFRGAE